MRAARQNQFNESSAADDPALDAESDDEARRRQRRIHENRADLGVMIAKNREERATGSPERYLGFRLAHTRDVDCDPREEPYRDAILPIDVARKYPELLGFLTLDYQTVYTHEILRSRTRVVIRPERFTTLRRAQRARWILIGSILIAIAAIVAAVAVVRGKLLSMRRPSATTPASQRS